MTFFELDDENSKYWTSFIEIYNESFSSSEQEDIKVIKNRVLEKRYILTLAQVEEEIVGFYLVDIVKKHSYAILTFLAISEKYRAKGYGTLLCSEMIKQALHLKDISYLFVEAEKRQAFFYKKLGFKKLLLDYNVPSFNTQESTQMSLLLVPITNKDMTYIDVKALKEIVSDVFIDGYSLNIDDERLKKQLNLINKDIRLESK